MTLVYPALTSGEQTALMGATTLTWHLSVVNSTRVTKARINQTSFTYPLAQLTIDGTDADWLAQFPGMTVYIGSTDGGSEKGIYRIRTAADPTTMYIGETSQGDPGLITQSIRTASFADDDYITILLDEFDLWSVAPRFTPLGVINEDYDQGVNNSNTYPEPIVNITINGDVNWADFVDVGQTYRTVTLLAMPILWPTSNSISSYFWTLPSSWTVVAGDIHTNTVTAQVPAQLENYTFQLRTVENHGSIMYSYRNVWAYDHGSNYPMTVTQLDSLTWDRTTMKASVTLYDALLANVPLGKQVVLWYECTWNGSDVPTAIKQWTGWVVHRTEHTEPGLRSASLDIEGVCGIMGRIGAYSQYFTAGSPANTWQIVVSTLQYVDFWIWWLIRHRGANILTLFNYQPLGISNLTGRLPQSKIPVAGSLLAQCQALVQSYTGNIGSNPDGTVLVRQHPNLLSTRTSVVKRAVFSASNYSVSDMSRMVYPTVRKVRGEGFYWDGASTLPTPFLTDAPGDAPGQGGREERLQGQFVDSQSDLNNKTSLYYAMLNNPLAEITLQFKRNWAVIRPAEMSFIEYTNPANLHSSNTAIDMNAIPISCTLKWDNTQHVADVDMTIEGETNNVTPGITVAIPNPIPTISPISTTNTTTSAGTFSHNGSSVIAYDNQHIGLGNYYTSGRTKWLSAALAASFSSGIQQIKLDPTSSFLVSKSGALGAYALIANDGLWYISNILDPSAVWTRQQSLPIQQVNTSSVTCSLRPSRTVPGDVYVAFMASNSSDAPAIHLSNYGTTIVNTTLTGALANGFGMDIDNYGTDEMLVAIRNGSTTFAVYQILNGGTMTRKTADIGQTLCYWIQKPLNTFGGLPNSSTGGSECFIFIGAANQHLYKTADGGATVVDITPSGSGGCAAVLSSVSSLAFTTNANAIAVVGASNNKIYTTMDGGSTWITGATFSTDLFSATMGYYPTQVGSNFALYGGGGGMFYSKDFGQSIIDATGDWTTSIGSISGRIEGVIPLY